MSGRTQHRPVPWRSSAGARGCSSMVERQLPKLIVRVRFPSPAPGENTQLVWCFSSAAQEQSRGLGQQEWRDIDPPNARCQLGRPGDKRVYVSTLHAAALRDGSRALVTQPGPGRPAELGGEALDRARQWRAAGVSDREIGGRLGIAGTTVSRRLGPRGAEATAADGPQEGGAAGCEPLVSEEDAAGAAVDVPGSGPEPAAGRVPATAGSRPAPAPASPPASPPAPVPPGDGAGVPGSGGGAGGGLVPAAGGAVPEGRVRSRYAGAMLLHAFGSQPATGTRWATRRAACLPRRGCWRPSAPASGWDTPRPSSSSTWRRPRPGRWPGWRPCRTCGPCGPRCAHRGPHRPAAAAAAVRAGDARRGPGDLRRVLRR